MHCSYPCDMPSTAALVRLCSAEAHRTCTQATASPGVRYRAQASSASQWYWSHGRHHNGTGLPCIVGITMALVYHALVQKYSRELRGSESRCCTYGGSHQVALIKIVVRHQKLEATFLLALVPAGDEIVRVQGAVGHPRLTMGSGEPRNGHHT